MSDRHPSAISQASQAPQDSLLSPHRTFVVQFRDEMDATPARFSGRVEHITSGHATRFDSPGELLAFFTRILATRQNEKERTL